MFFLYFECWSVQYSKVYYIHSSAIRTTNVIDFLDVFQDCTIQFLQPLEWVLVKRRFRLKRASERVPETEKEIKKRKRDMKTNVTHKNSSKSMELIKSNDFAFEFQVFFSSSRFSNCRHRCRFRLLQGLVFLVFFVLFVGLQMLLLVSFVFVGILCFYLLLLAWLICGDTLWIVVANCHFLPRYCKWCYYW